MQRVTGVTVLGLAVVFGLIGWSGNADAASVGPSAKSSQQVAGGGVTVSATLLKDRPDVTAIKLGLDTHSVNLDGYDFRQIAGLRDDKGKTYPVESVEQASGGGHHRQAVLRFGNLDPDAKKVELIVKDVGGVNERTFLWSLTQ